MNKSFCTVDTKQTVVLWGVYLSYLLMLPAFIGLIVSHFKSNQFKDCLDAGISGKENRVSLLASHHCWCIRTFVFSLLLTMVGIGSMYAGVGFFVAIFASIWWFHRTIRGMIALAGNKAMPT